MPMQITAQGARIAGWVCAGLSLVILLNRTVAARVKQGHLDVSTAICFASILVVAARLGVNQYVLLYGTSNDTLHTDPQYLDAAKLHALKIGSILALMARLLITTFYWLQICLLLLFYSQMIQIRSRWTTSLIRVGWVAIPVTYAVVVLATFLECEPFRRYWKVYPDPGRCVQAYIQLLAQGICNICLDLLLLAISCPVVFMRHRSVAEAVRVGLLFCLGFFCIIVTCVRIVYIYAEGSTQPVRSFWASVQMVVSCFVANAPTIYGCFTLIRRRKSERMLRRGSRPEVWLQLQTTNDSRAARHPIAINEESSEPAPSVKKVPAG